MISFFLFVFRFFCVWKRGGNEYPQIKKTKILKICLDYLTTHYYYLKQFSPHPTIPSPPKQTGWRKETVTNWLNTILICTLTFPEYDTQLYEWRTIFHLSLIVPWTATWNFFNLALLGKESKKRLARSIAPLNYPVGQLL